MMQNSSEQPLMSDLNIVLLGKTGAGKSATGNTILGDRRPFKEEFSPSSVTSICKLEQTQVGGQTINVIDTVGLPDTLKKITDVQTKIEQIFACTSNGVDVFLLVIKLGEKFTGESKDVVKWILDNFGAKFSKHTIVLFTHGDQLPRDKTKEEYLKKSPILQSVVDQYSGRYHVLDNEDKDLSQVRKLLEKLNKLRENNRDTRYTEQDYKETQDQILQEKYRTGAAKGAAVGGGVGVLGGAGAAIAAKAGALTLGKVVAAGAAGGAVVGAVAVCAGVYFFARRYTCNSETRESSRNKKQKQFFQNFA